MLIHNAVKPQDRCSRFSRVLQEITRPIMVAFFFGIVIGLILYSELSLLALWRNYGPEVRRPFAIILNWFDGMFAKVPMVHMDISYRNFAKLAKYRRNYTSPSSVEMPQSPSVPVSLRYSAGVLKGSARLKGIGLDHYLDDKKWSFRIRLENSQYLDGMSTFSLLNPLTRDFLAEWLFLTAAKDEGILAPRTKFIDLHVNGDSYGTYLLEEDYSKRLVESSQRRDGPILSYSKDLLIERWYKLNWAKKMAGPIDIIGLPRDGERSQNSWLLRPFDLVEPKRINESAELRAIADRGANMLDGFRKGSLQVSEVFDARLLSTVLALRVLFASSEFDPNDFKLYFNPISNRLEPIASEIHFISDGIQYPEQTWWYLALTNNHNWYFEKDFLSLFFRDATFVRLFLKELERLSSEKYLIDFFKRHRQEMSDNLSAIHASFPQYSFNEQLFETNAALIRSLLYQKPLLRFSLTASEDNQQLNIKVTNLSPFPVSLKRLQLDSNMISLEEQRIVLSGRKASNFPIYTEYSVAVKPDMLAKANLLEATLVSTIDGMSREIADKVSPVPDGSSTVIRMNFTTPDKPFAPWEVDMAKSRIKLKGGTWKINTPVLIPPGFTVVNDQSFKWIFASNTGLTSESPLYLNGTATDPIEFKGNGSSGILILNTLESEFNFVHFIDLAPQGPSLTGAVTVYKSNIKFDNCLFENSKAEDALNLVNSIFSIAHTIVNKSFSDGIDCDFSQGTLTDVACLNSGNDALDFSGCKGNVQRLTVKTAKEKGISVGERSIIDVSDSNISGVAIGLAAKDLSNAHLKGVSIQDTSYGLAAFQKKAEFGPAFISGENLSLNSTRKVICERSSQVLIEGKKELCQEENLRERFYPTNEANH